MKKKNYNRPMMQVVKFQQGGKLLSGSGVQVASRNGYGTAIDEDWN